MEAHGFLIYAFIGSALVFQVVLWNFMELRNKKVVDENNVSNSSPAPAEETQPPRDDDSNDTDAPTPPRPKRKKKDHAGEGGSSSASTPFCRFCKQVFTSPQALGGHMNRHRGEREKEEYKKAEILINTRGQNFNFGYPGYPNRGAPAYYQPEGNQYGNHYQGGGPGQAANAPMVGNMGSGHERQAYPNPNQQFGGAPQVNRDYGTHQQSAQANNYQAQPQHGGSYGNYNQGDNAPRPPHHVQGGVPQSTSYAPRANSGQYQVQGSTGSSRDVKPHAGPHGGSASGVGHHPSHTGYTGHNSSQAAGGANLPTRDIAAILGTTTAGNHSNALCQSTAAQLFDQSGSILTQGPSSGYQSIGLRRLNPSHFHDSVQVPVQVEEYDQGPPQDQYNSQASYAGASGHGILQVPSDHSNAGMENQYQNPGVEMLNFEDAQEGAEF